MSEECLVANVPNDQLKKYNTVQIYVAARTRSCPLGDGCRSVFWGWSDGRSSIVIDPTTGPMMLALCDFTINKVFRADEYKIKDRLRANFNGEWKDLGALTPEGSIPTDSFKVMELRRQLMAPDAPPLKPKEPKRPSQRAYRVSDKDATFLGGMDE